MKNRKTIKISPQIIRMANSYARLNSWENFGRFFSELEIKLLLEFIVFFFEPSTFFNTKELLIIVGHDGTK